MAARGGGAAIAQSRAESRARNRDEDDSTDTADERYVTFDAVFDSDDDDDDDDATDVDTVDGSDDDARRARGMGAPAAEFRLTCPDKTGLGADICRVAFEFGLVVTRGDFTTDGVWALVLLTVRAGKVRAGDVRGVERGRRGAAGDEDEDEDDEDDDDDDASARAFRRARRTVRRAMRAAMWAYGVARARVVAAANAARRRAGMNASASGRGRAGAILSGETAPRASKIKRYTSEGSCHGENAALMRMTQMRRSCVVDWELLRQRLELLCPHKSTISTIPSVDSLTKLDQTHSQNMYILQVECQDRVGLLHDVTLALWELQLTVHRAHVTTSPSSKAVDLFYVTDDLHELPNPARVGDISRYVRRIIASTDDDRKRVNILVHPAPPFVTRQSRTKALRESDGMIVTEANPSIFHADTTVEIDNLMSPAHTVFQIRTRDRQGLLYDCLRVSKDLKVSVSYAKIEIVDRSRCEIALFTRNIKDKAQMEYLCAKYKEHVDHPLKVEMLCNHVESLTSELRVVAPLDIAGHTRPRVLLDVTEALQDLDVMIFKADILIDPRTVDNAIQDEVHRFLLTDRRGEPISTPEARQEVCDRVFFSLMRS